MNQQTFRTQIAFLSQLFGKTLSDDVYRMYWNLFKNKSDEEFSAICTNLVKSFVPTSQVPFPLPAHFLEANNESGDKRARAAIMAINNAVSRIGPYKSVNFGDRALHATIERFGGWVELCNWDQQSWQFNEKNFIATYESALQDGSGPDYLMGIAEFENGKKQLSGKQLEIAEKMNKMSFVKWSGFDEKMLLDNKSEKMPEIGMLNDVTSLLEKKICI